MNAETLQIPVGSGSLWPCGLELPLHRARGGKSLRQWLQSLWFSLQPQATTTTVSTQDHRDIQATLGGDGQAYEQLVERYQADVAGWMWRFTRDRTEWEVLVQDVFVEAYLALDNYRAKGVFGAWLRTVATRVGYRYWKQRARTTQREPWSLQDWDRAADIEHITAVEAAEAGREVHDVLAQLPPRDRLVLTLHYLDGHSVAEISQQVGWTKTMVKVQMHRARGKLRRLLEDSDA